MGTGILKIFDVAADGLSAQRLKMNTVSENIANAETTRTNEGGPYRRKRVVFDAPTQRAAFRSELRAATLRMRQTRSGHAIPPKFGMGAAPGVKPTVTADAQAVPFSQVKYVFDPSHPDADGDGYVAMPDINIITEMVDLMSASRAYEANLTTVEAAKAMASRALEI